MTNEKITINTIEAVTEAQAQAAAEEMATIKDHQVYFVDFGGYFGFSALVFAEGMHIYYANDYELHHNGKSKDELKQLYIKKLNNILFTEKELKTPTNNYTEYERREYYIRNYYTMRRPYISAFRFTRTEEDEKNFKKEVENLFYNPVGFNYCADGKFIKKCIDLLDTVLIMKDKAAQDYDFIKAAFIYEMGNHEYMINWQGDYDVISCFANVDGVKDYENINELMKAAGFNDTQKRAYIDARREYIKNNNDNY